MIELSVRLLVAGSLLFLAGTFGAIDFDIAWKVGLAIAAVAGFSHRLELKGLKSPAVAGAFALLDSFLIATVLDSNGRLGTLGFLSLAPCIYAASRDGARAAVLAPLCSFSILLADQALHGGTQISNPILMQAGAVMLLGLIVAVSQRPAPTPPDEVAISVAAADFKAELEEDTNVLVLRERYRRLRDAYDELDGRTRKYKVLASLADAQSSSVNGRAKKVIERLTEATGLQGMLLFGPAEFSPKMTVRVAVGSIPEAAKTDSLALFPNLSQAQMQQKYQEALMKPMLGRPFETVVLVHHGKVVGLLAMLHDDPAVLESARRTAEASVGQIASLVAESAQKSETDRRLREAELLYSLASLARGAESVLDVASRFAREIRDILFADHAAVFMIDGDQALSLAQDGTDMRLLDAMSFAAGPGLNGWRGVGSPELLLFDVRADSRVPSDAIRKQRVGSFFLVPFQSGDISGFVTVATTQIGGLDLGAAETTRIVSAELGRAMDRSEATSNEGIMTPTEFQSRVIQEPGVIVVFEQLRKDQLETQFGRIVMQGAIRTFLRRIGSRLPSGAGVSRNETGQIMVFLPDTNEAFAATWANEMAAVASMIGVRTPGGTTRIPFAVRAKIATYNSQNSRFFDRLTA